MSHLSKLFYLQACARVMKSPSGSTCHLCRVLFVCDERQVSVPAAAPAVATDAETIAVVACFILSSWLEYCKRQETKSH